MPEAFAEILMRGIGFEGLRESINIEIAHHTEAMDTVGQDSPEGRAHLEAVARLATVRRLLTPDNPAAVTITGLLLDHGRAARQAGGTA
ncbi:hypothetical protein M2359_000400 [Gordonia amarae]|uniref:Uncharacterized protein n=1 Tax=Gordonia amarae NBRC 15530 TaxID=1075090 RepID=G7GQ51_9ACTN|nr:hypothetical protein [Gordonia amarae]MCS3876771.1 hypothetical protein [Gordonia amarae]GAB05726.1 hypothetical protein GOAMR_43_00190 [Gordonia amarae NBRC 15530]